MVKRATTLLSEDPERSFWERLGLRLARFQVTVVGRAADLLSPNRCLARRQESEMRLWRFRALAGGQFCLSRARKMKFARRRMPGGMYDAALSH